jgi:hypothetical protein
MTCPYCDGLLWVCEAHPDQPWLGRHACICGASGMPCPICNPCDNSDPSQLPPDFADDEDISRCH